MSTPLVFLGDVALLDDRFSSSYAIDGTYVFNMEYVAAGRLVTPANDKVLLASPYHDFATLFGGTPTAVCLANNHALDGGDAGVESTLSILGEMGIDHFGIGDRNRHEGNRIACVSLNGLRIALVGYNLFEGKNEGRFTTASYSLEACKQDVFHARNTLAADRVVVNIHWGVEEAPRASSAQRHIAHELVDAGADLVIGHHPHCVQEAEVYNGKAIFFSMGDTVMPNLNEPGFFSVEGQPKRIFRKRQMPWNRKSLAVVWDAAESRVVRVDRLKMKGNRLFMVKSVPAIPKFHAVPGALAFLVWLCRKMVGFVTSNALVDGKLFDFGAVRHELALRNRNRMEKE